MLSTLRSLVNAILGKVPGKPGRLDTSTRMVMDPDFAAKPKAEPKGNSQRDEREAPKVDPIEELRRIIDSPAGSHSLQQQSLPVLSLRARCGRSAWIRTSRSGPRTGSR
jgi:hypothetical protein